MRARATLRPGERGFSLVELLVTVVLAGIIFLAMVPLFVSGLKTTSTNTRRIVATNIAQARIESMRMLNWNEITQANLNSSTFAAGQFATTYTPPAGGHPYTITTSVSPTASPSPMPTYKTVAVTVTNPVDNFTTTVTTVIANPAAVSATSASGPQAGNGPYSITCQFKNSSEVTSAGVLHRPVPDEHQRLAHPNSHRHRDDLADHDAGRLTHELDVSPGRALPGGMGYLYTVTCNSTIHPQISTPAFPPVRQRRH